MLGFLVKRFFFDFIDNFFQFFLLNLGFILVICAGLGISRFLQSLVSPFLEANTFFVQLGWLLLVTNVYTGAASGVIHEITENQRPGFKDFFYCLKMIFPLSLLYSLLNAVLFFLLYNTFFFYLNLQLAFSPFAVAFIIWLAVIWLLVSQFFYVIYWRLEKKFFRILKKMVLFFLDNLLYNLAICLALGVICIISFPTLFMIPGLISTQLLLAIAVKSRLYKYAYLETSCAAVSNAGNNSVKIPWAELLEKDSQRLRGRTLKNTFLPWKKE